MQHKAFVLAHRETPTLFVKLTFSRKASKPQWEWTDDLENASSFDSEHDAEERQRDHRVPPTIAKPRLYETAHSDWLRGKEITPHGGKQSHFF